MGTGPYLSRPARLARFPAHPFQLGVASGDPTPDGVVLWTRLAPMPLHPDPAAPGGMAPQAVPVRWEVAADERFGEVVRRGETIARPELAHSVHVEVGGLRPGRDYFYRFLTGGDVSAVGRTRTAPERSVQQVRYAFVSCQMYEHGFFTAYRHLAAEDLDVVLHLGDYIYEYGAAEHPPALGGDARGHGQGPAVDLTGYRLRHALYRLDPDLQAAHAAAPWIVTWDDHDVANNYLDRGDPVGFAARRAAAYQAYYEHLPLRASALPRGPQMRLFRRLGYGDLMDLHVLDTRQYRNAPPVPGGATVPGPERHDPARSILGDVQENWLADGLTRSRARWQIIAQQVFFSPRAFPPADQVQLDSWDGYPANRARLLRTLAERRIRPVVLTGDVHSNWAADLKSDFGDPESATVGAELVGTSISSGGNGSDTHTDTEIILAQNPHLRFFDNHRGYVRCTVTPDHLRADFRVVPYVSLPGAPVFTRASFQLDAGRPGLRQVLDRAPSPAERVAEPTPEAAAEG
ncbi:alkaline phosphatase D family protein [Actinomadura scrupuli]|uniref:alkaline phosphatase D family protein n=1 Tax=Actinomadura scrupuli TaxID=559629 RepID=UPI003D99D65A